MFPIPFPRPFPLPFIFTLLTVFLFLNLVLVYNKVRKFLTAIFANEFWVQVHNCSSAQSNISSQDTRSLWAISNVLLIISHLHFHTTICLSVILTFIFICYGATIKASAIKTTKSMRPTKIRGFSSKKSAISFMFILSFLFPVENMGMIYLFCTRYSPSISEVSPCARHCPHPLLFW